MTKEELLSNHTAGVLDRDLREDYLKTNIEAWDKELWGYNLVSTIYYPEGAEVTAETKAAFGHELLHAWTHQKGFVSHHSIILEFPLFNQGRKLVAVQNSLAHLKMILNFEALALDKNHFLATPCDEQERDAAIKTYSEQKIFATEQPELGIWLYLHLRLLSDHFNVECGEGFDLLKKDLGESNFEVLESATNSWTDRDDCLNRTFYEELNKGFKS